jgi:hypothetical protein
MRPNGAHMKIRKQVYELSIEDLETHPVWEFASDEESEEGQDEATVRPYSQSGPADAADGSLIVRASFTLADGTLMKGYLTPPPPRSTGIGDIQPEIVTPKGNVSFWYGARKPSPEIVSKAYEILGNDSASVFPVHFISDVEIVSGPVSGTLNGFMYTDSKSKAVHEFR